MHMTDGATLETGIQLVCPIGAKMELITPIKICTIEKNILRELLTNSYSTDQKHGTAGAPLRKRRCCAVQQKQVILAQVTIVGLFVKTVSLLILIEQNLPK